MCKVFTCILGMMFISFISINSANAASSSITVKGKIPVGVSIGKNKVMAKKGYIFEKAPNGHVVSRMRGGKGGITGDFDCTCNGGEGGCSIQTTPNSVSCYSSGCKSSCYMIVTVPGTSSVLH